MATSEASNNKHHKRKRLVRLIGRLLSEIGDNPEREGLKETPERVAKAYAEWFRGYERPPFEVKKFKTKYNGIIARVGIPFQSFCEHHMARYSGVIHFAYIPSGHVLGLSKIIRLAQHWAARLTIQEDLTAEITAQFMAVLGTKDVAVVVSALHSCESTRGVKVANVPTVTASMGGKFFTEKALRDEFYQLVNLEK